MQQSNLPDIWPQGLLPEYLIRFEEREDEVTIGLVISGHWDTSMDDWDLSYPFYALMTDGSIEECKSCLAESVTVMR